MAIWRRSALLSTTSFLLLLSVFWVTKINNVVPKPYLIKDEVFHVRQAQAYCNGDFHIWDPKITTPPGLYIINWILHRLGLPCSTSLMRVTNSILHVLGVLPCALICRLARFGRLEPLDQNLSDALHTSVNICLFPVLFFFSGLYYTDIASTVVVLAVLTVFSQRNNTKWFSRTSQPQLLIFLMGLISLWFRQTNVFWVAIFPGALAVVDSMPVFDRFPKGGDATLLTYIRWSWDQGAVFDPFVSSALFQDYLLASLTIVIAFARKSYNCFTSPSTYLIDLFGLTVPYASIITIFGAFVVWNGGVVMGDKSNHVATIHLPQMLYIWPNFTFFSWPLIYPYVAGPYLDWAHPRSGSHDIASAVYSSRLLSIPTFIALLTGASIIVYLNTIIHPFTLADNRHYVFYVFRIMRRHPAIRYLFSPIYVICSWAVIRATGSEPIRSEDEIARSTDLHHSLREPLLSRQQSCRASFVIVWVGTTTLCLVTAPLVEPRYLILPWIIWRLSIPNPYMSLEKSDTATQKAVARQVRTKTHGDHRLWLETAWFILINFITGYIFLYRGFAWPQEVGNVQRFLW